MEGPDDKLCSKCGGFLDTTGFPRWCKKCQAAYRRDYVALRKQRIQKSGYLEGVQAMREYLANAFETYGPLQRFDGPAIAGIVRRVAAPPLPGEPAQQ